MRFFVLAISRLVNPPVQIVFCLFLSKLSFPPLPNFIISFFSIGWGGFNEIFRFADNLVGEPARTDRVLFVSIKVVLSPLPLFLCLAK